VTSFSTGSADPADPAERPGGAPARADSRTAELSAALAAVETRIAAACSAAGRDRAGVTLVVVTKTYPGDDVARLAALGVRDVGENREQEGAAKHAECAGLGLGWHFIGQLQTNKARSVAGWADLVHSVDRSPLVAALARGAERAGRVLDCLVQVSLDGDPARGGVPLQELPALAEAVAGASALRLRGVMAVAPLGADPFAAFAVLPRLLDEVRRVAPGADVVSAGMSGDLEAAVACGATHLRVGTAILGRRPALG
jgi:pyridoxal phosphate enzyme (YggS family)